MPKPLLLSRPSGLYARFLVPTDLRAAIGSRFLVRPLHEPAGDRARLVAACMGVALSQAFEAIRQGDAVDLKKALEAARAAGRRDLIIKGMTLRNGTHVAEAQLETLQDVEMLERLMGQVAEKDPLAAAVAGYLPQVPKLATVPSGPLLSVCIDKHLTSLGKLAPKTIIESRHSLRILLGLVGDIPVSTLDADHVQAFMDAVEHWPRNATKHKLYRDLSVLEVLALSKRNGEKAPASATLSKHWDRLRVFISHLRKQRLLQLDPMEGIASPSERRGVEEPETGRPFTHDELKAVFGSGFLRWASKYPHRFWGPILGLYSGARVNEVAQLRAADVMHVDGVAGFLVTTLGEGNKVKNTSSLRFVPLAQPVLDAGFLHFVDEVRASGVDRLFPDLPNSTGLGFGRQLSRQFSTYIKREGITEEGMGFHAFRHYFITHMDRALLATGMEVGARDVAIGRITGHGKPPKSVLRKVYVDNSGLAVPAAVQPETLPLRVETLAMFNPPVTLPSHVPGQFEENLQRAATEARRTAREAKRNKTSA